MNLFRKMCRGGWFAIRPWVICRLAFPSAWFDNLLRKPTKLLTLCIFQSLSESREIARDASTPNFSKKMAGIAFGWNRESYGLRLPGWPVEMSFLSRKNGPFHRKYCLFRREIFHFPTCGKGQRNVLRSSSPRVAMSLASCCAAKSLVFRAILLHFASVSEIANRKRIDKFRDILIFFMNALS